MDTSIFGGVNGFWLNVGSVVLASMIAMRISKGRTEFNFKDVGKDLYANTAGFIISSVIVYFMATQENPNWNSPIVLAVIMLAYLILNTKRVREFFG